MKGKNPDQDEWELFTRRIENMVDQRKPLIKLANRIPWKIFEKEFEHYYLDFGRPAKPIRLMVSLMILKQMFNVSDERVVEQWGENPYWQYFSGEIYFQCKNPCDASDLVYFRKRIGKYGVEKILEVSVKIHGKKAEEKEILVDTTVQEKNITFPTDTKLHVKIIKKCWEIAEKEKTGQRQSYKRVIKKHLLNQRFRNHPKNKNKARASAKKIKTIAGRLIRELERTLSEDRKKLYAKKLELYKKILNQKKNDKNKVYSLHENEVHCISKGKEHKKYEFGNKASIAMTRDSGIIVGALNVKNQYDGHTLPEVLDQVEKILGKRPRNAICDKGYRGKSEIEGTKILIPKPPKKKDSHYQKKKMRKRFRRRAGIEPIIGHLKSDHRMARNFLKGSIGDDINIMMAAAAFNFKKYMRWLLKKICRFIFQKISLRFSLKTSF